MIKRPATTLGAVFFAAAVLIVQPSAQADTFGSGSNAFTLDFVSIGNAGNAADTTGYGAVPYEYRVGVFEISQTDITKATASGMSNVTAGAWGGSAPAASISWYEAAAFVNWLNTSSGYQAAYNLSFSSTWSMSLWSSTDAWTLGSTNLYRHKDAYYFLPSENEWYKAAYYNSSGANYFLYPTGSSNAPIAVSGSSGGTTNAGTAIYNGSASPAPVTNAGGLSPYGTMAQGGNVREWMESAFSGTNNSPTNQRTTRGGSYNTIAAFLQSSFRDGRIPTTEGGEFGFRVASVPEPSTYALLVMTGAGALYAWGRRRRSNTK